MVRGSVSEIVVGFEIIEKILQLDLLQEEMLEIRGGSPIDKQSLGVI